MINPIDSIAKISIQLILSEPFYGHFMIGMPKEISIRTKTAAVALYNKKIIKLLVNYTFWQNLSKEYQYGIIKHEILHIVFKHLFTMSAYSNKVLYNISADLVVNQYINPNQLPNGVILIKCFDYLQPMYGISLTLGMDVGYYYHSLSKIYKEKPLISFEEACIYVRTTLKNNTHQINIDDVTSDYQIQIQKHSFWIEFENLSESEKKVAEYQSDRILLQATDRVKTRYQNYGNLPKGLVEKINSLIENLKPKIDWRRSLRLFASSSNSTYIKNTIRKASKRYGTVPGIKIKRRNKILVAIDTSCSINNDKILDFFNEIHHIWLNGAEIIIVECDVIIHKTYIYNGEATKTIIGRGGTNFNAPIKFSNEKIRPDALIYFTDGAALKPSIKSRYPLLWAISNNNFKKETFDHLPGKKLFLND